MDTNGRRGKRASIFRRAGWLAVASMVALSLAGPGASGVAADTGATWTTSITCTTPAPQDQNQYNVGDHVYLRATNLTPSTTYYWQTIQTNASGNPKPVVDSGSIATDENGAFCVDTHTIAAGEAGGEYDTQVATDTSFSPAKHDNYSVNAYTPPSTATLTLVKHVSGGDALATAWTLTAAGPTTISGNTGDPEITSATVNVGTYALSESGGPANYDASLWNCGDATVTAGSVTLAAGVNVTCTITNTYSPPPNTYCIDISKVNGSEQGLPGAVFTIKQDGSPVDVTGNPVTTDGQGDASLCGLAAGDYTVSETTPPTGYTGAAPKTVTLPVDNATGNGSLTFVDTLIVVPPTPSVGTTCGGTATFSNALAGWTLTVDSVPVDAFGSTGSIGPLAEGIGAHTYSVLSATGAIVASGSFSIVACTLPPPPPTCTQLGTCPVVPPVVPPVVQTPTPTSSVEAATSMPSPTGSVLSATSKPHVTPPPTDTLPTSGTPAGDTWRIALLGLAALLASLLILSPTSIPERRRR